MAHTENINVELGKRSYRIVIGSGILQGLGGAISESLSKTGKAALVSNPTVHAIYGKSVEKSLRRAGYQVITVLIPDGERYKTLKSAELIWGEMLKARLERASFIVALGGGVVGDIAGFAASAYMRGIRFVQVPTTLLAQVDSSVGGKTGVNHPLGKNMIGAFWQPSLVWIDTETLKTLPPRELPAGMAEVIKYGVIKDRRFFSYLRDNAEAVKCQRPAELMHIVATSCRIKAQVVSRDERESGLRAILNYGHTVGHAIETLTNYKKYLHGEAVAIGMCAEAEIASRKGLITRPEVEQIQSVVEAYGLPSSLPKGLLKRNDIAKAMTLDKKVLAGEVRMVLPERIGKVLIDTVSRGDLP
ncbi:MAG: 3-dehydroquinate synthase [Actinomycetota bacterium]|nr:3-dehydroquinate synthase [Actinomycetota bacterium]